MPFYEYECRACGAQTEVLQKISDKPLRKCEACGKSSLVKLVSAPIFRLKGGGWYETDFKSDQDRKRNLVGDADDKPKTESKDTAEGKPAADSKPAEAQATSKKADSTKAGSTRAEAPQSSASKASTSRPRAKPVKTAARSSRAKTARAK